MKKTISVVAAIFVILLTGCNKQCYLNNQEIQQLYEAASKSHVDESIVSTNYDDERNSYFYDYATCGGNYIYYAYPERYIVLDINDMTYESLCSVAGCDHTGGTCENSFDKYLMRYYHGGVYYPNGSSLYYRNSKGENIKVFTNKYSSEWSRKMDPQNPSLIAKMIFIDENTLLMAGRNYYFKYDVTKDEASEPVVLPDGVIFSFCYKDGIIYSSYSNGTLVRTEWERGKSEVLSERIDHVQMMNNRIWYVKAANRTISLFSNNLNYTDERQEVTGMGGLFHVLGDAVAYMGEDDKTYYLYDTNGEIRELFNIQNLQYPYEKLPETHQYDEYKNNPDAETISFLHYENGNVYFTAQYDTRMKNGNDFWNVFYKVDMNGKITEFMERDALLLDE